MRIIRSFLVVVSVGAVVFAPACSDNTFSTPGNNLTGFENTNTTEELNIKEPKKEIVTSIKNVVTCPAEGDTYTFIDAFNPKDKAVPLLPEKLTLKTFTTEQLQTKTDAPQTYTYKDVASFTTTGYFILTIKNIVAGTTQDCYFEDILMKIYFAENFKDPAVIVETESTFFVTPVSKLVTTAGIKCEEFKPNLGTGKIKAIAYGSAIDHTRIQTTEEVVAPVDANLAKGKKSLDISLNALPPDAKAMTEEGPITSDYIYFLTKDQWVGRAKPEQMQRGCIEYIWNNPDYNNDIRDKLIIAGISTRGGYLDLLISETRKLAINLATGEITSLKSE